MNFKKSLEKKAKKGFRGYPIATIAFYGPTNKLATKIAIGLITHEGAEPIMMRWHSATDIRLNTNVFKEVLTTIKAHSKVCRNDEQNYWLPS
jgi:hypothetical protein